MGLGFLINLPLVAFALVAVTLWVPESEGHRGRGVDPPGILLSTAGLGGFTYGVMAAGERRGDDPRSLLTVAGGGLALVAFVLWQRRAQASLIDLALFRSRGFTGGTILATVAGAYSVDPAHRRRVRHVRRGPHRRRPRVRLHRGLATAAGIGLGFTLPPAMSAALGTLTPVRSGVGSGLIQALRQVGVAAAGAVLALLLLPRAAARPRPREEAVVLAESGT